MIYSDEVAFDLYQQAGSDPQVEDDEEQAAAYALELERRQQAHLELDEEDSFLRWLETYNAFIQRNELLPE